MCKPSFIDENTKKISESEFWAERNKSLHLSFSQKTRPVLENLDLSEIDFSENSGELRKNFDGWIIRNVIFSKFNPKSKEKKSLFGLSFRGAKMDRVVFAQASLDRCNFDCLENEQIKICLFNRSIIIITDKESTLDKVDFFFSEFSYCRFRGCKMDMVDFRYAKVSDCSMNEINVTYGDFYDCNFKGCTAFLESNFTKCSFTNAVFEHQVIHFESIHNILQDNINDYRKIIDVRNSKWERYNPCGTKRESSPDDEEIRKEAKEMYRHLSGIYAGKGLNNDSNAAYGKMKKKELRISWENAKDSVFGLLFFLILLGFLFCKLIEYGYMNCKVVFSCIGIFALYKLYDSIKGYVKMVLRYIWQKIEDLYGVVSGCITYFMGYGYKWLNVIIAYLLLILIGALFFYYKFDDICSWQEALEYSFYNLTGLQNNLPNDGWKGVIVGFYHLLGVLLIGYLGFIFANKMRNNL